MPPDVTSLTKTQFAALCRVTPGRVSQWITEGKIGPEEMEGTGRKARMIVARAAEKLKLRLDAGRRNGNGLHTTLPSLLAPEAPPGAAFDSDNIHKRLLQEKLLAAAAQNRKLAEDEKARRGIYVRAEHASAEATHLAATILQTFEGGLNQLAGEVADAYKMPARDVAHMMRKGFRELRGRIAAKLTADAAALPPLIEDD